MQQKLPEGRRKQSLRKAKTNRIIASKTAEAELQQKIEVEIAKESMGFLPKKSNIEPIQKMGFMVHAIWKAHLEKNGIEACEIKWRITDDENPKILEIRVLSYLKDVVLHRMRHGGLWPNIAMQYICICTILCGLRTFDSVIKFQISMYYTVLVFTKRVCTFYSLHFYHASAAGLIHPLPRVYNVTEHDNSKTIIDSWFKKGQSIKRHFEKLRE